MSGGEIKIESAEGEVFLVKCDVISLSTTISNLMRDLGIDGQDASRVETIPVQNVKSAILRKIIAWCQYHAQDPFPDGANGERLIVLTAWDKDFMKVDQSTLFDIVLAANYLEVKGLFDLACGTVAEMMRGKSADEIRGTFNIPNNLTPEEVERIRRENSWCE